MTITVVNDPKTIRDFHSVPYEVYKSDSNWIPHLRQDVEKTFDPKQNKTFRNGEAVRWVVYSDEGKAIARMAAFVNTKYSKSMKQPTGGLGFFDCIEDEGVAHKLFDTGVKWLLDRDVKAVDGPINFGEKDRFWGLLTENFVSPSSYAMNYNLSYYQRFFESYGFEVFYEQFVFYRDLTLPAQEIFVRKSETLLASGEYSISDVNGWSLDKIAKSFCAVYNNAWGGFPGFKTMPLKQAQNIVKSLKPIMDRDIIIFAFHKDRPIGFYVNIPELNDIFKFVNGNLNWLGKLTFLYHKWKKTPRTMVGLVFGVDREYHRLGVEGALIAFAGTHIRGLGRYKDTVMTWIGDFNPKMINIAEKLGASKHRVLRTYRYMIDKNIPFERMGIVK